MALQISSVCRNITPSATLGLNAMVAELKKQGQDIISLAAGEPDFDTPAHIVAAATEAMAQGKTKYTAVPGIPELRRAISAHWEKTRGLKYAPDQIIVGTGAKQVLLGALIAILEPGDEVLLPAPCWLSYPEMVRMAGGVPVPVIATFEQGFVPDAAALRAACTERTRAILLNSPNNPTGAVWTKEQLQAAVDLAIEKDLYIISDEIYEALIYGDARHFSPAGFGEKAFERTITVSGFSKTYAMTGWRLGYAAGPKAVIKAMDAYQSHATGNPNSIAQYAAIAALEGDQGCVEEMRKAFNRRGQLFHEALEKVPGLKLAAPQGAFYLLADISALLGKKSGDKVLETDADFAQQLLEKGLVSAVPGDAFWAPGCIRMSYALKEGSLLQAAQRIADFVASLT